MSFFKYLKESAAEVKHISWPTSRQAGIYTVLVILISVFAAAYIGLFDKLFTGIVDATLPASQPAPGIEVSTPVTAPDEDTVVELLTEGTDVEGEGDANAEVEVTSEDANQ